MTKTAAEHAAHDGRHLRQLAPRRTSFLSLLNLVGAVKVVANEDGTIIVPHGRRTRPACRCKWREIEPFVWRDVDGKNLLAAEVKDGRVVRFSFDDFSPFMVFEPTPRTSPAAGCCRRSSAAWSALLLTALAWPIRRWCAATTACRSRSPARREGASLRCASPRRRRWSLLGGLERHGHRDDGQLQSAERHARTAGCWLLQMLSLIVFLGAAAVGVWNAVVVVRGPRRWYAKTWAVVLGLALLVAAVGGARVPSDRVRRELLKRAMTLARSMEMHVEIERLPLKAPFRISGYTFTEVPVAVVDARDRRHCWVAVRRLASTTSRTIRSASRARSKRHRARHRERHRRETSLRELLPPGGARNALDCALWDLEAQARGTGRCGNSRASSSVEPRMTTFTLSADDPAIDGAQARRRLR